MPIAGTSNLAMFMSGQVLVVDGGETALSRGFRARRACRDRDLVAVL